MDACDIAANKLAFVINKTEIVIVKQQRMH